MICRRCRGTGLYNTSAPEVVIIQRAALDVVRTWEKNHTYEQLEISIEILKEALTNHE
jgi:hypothetical protein